MENILNIQYIICSKHELMCCGCVQWCDTDEPFVVVVVMNNIVPPTVQSVSMADRQRAPSREEECFGKARSCSHPRRVAVGVFACVELRVA